MRARAGTMRLLSTVAKTAFWSGTVAAVTTKVLSACTDWTSAIASQTMRMTGARIAFISRRGMRCGLAGIEPGQTVGSLPVALIDPAQSSPVRRRGYDLARVPGLLDRIGPQWRR